jgi:hypothetical protein
MPIILPPLSVIRRLWFLIRQSKGRTMLARLSILGYSRAPEIMLAISAVRVVAFFISAAAMLG